MSYNNGYRFIIYIDNIFIGMNEYWIQLYIRLYSDYLAEAW